jgi:hypothetical protein
MLVDGVMVEVGMLRLRTIWYGVPEFVDESIAFFLSEGVGIGDSSGITVHSPESTNEYALPIRTKESPLRASVRSKARVELK